jgi:hypothetical protein
VHVETADGLLELEGIKTMRTTTIMAFLSELVETHMEKCSPDNDIQHIVSERDKTAADISSIHTANNTILLTLNNGDAFHIAISKLA